MDDGLSLNCTIHLNKWSKYVVLFGGNVGAVNLRPVFKTQVTVTYANNMTAIGLVVDRANVDLAGITAAKDLSKLTASDAMAVITSNCFSFAGVNNLTTLKRQMKNSTSAKLLKEKDENFVSRCNNLNTLLTNVLASYTTADAFFTADDLTAAMLLVADFDSKMGVWAVAETDVNNAKIEFEFTWMPRMADLLVVLEGMLPGAIKTGFPRFVSSFISLKKLVKVGVKDQGVLVTMEDSLTLAKFILVGRMETLNYNVATQKVLMTDASGLFKLMKLKVGIWKIKFSAPGYVDEIIEVTIKAKKVLRLDVKLVAIHVVREVVE